MSNRIDINFSQIREILSDLIDVSIAARVMVLNQEIPADELRKGIDIISHVVRESSGEIAKMFNIGPELMIPLIISRVNDAFPTPDAKSDAEPDDAAKRVADEILAKMKAGK